MAKKRWIGFSKDFMWGVGSAAHQIEGNNSNSDWWLFEQQPGKIKNSDKSGVACDHWNRLEEDVKVIKESGAKVYRFSVEWAKIQPTADSWDESAIAHYQQEIEILIQNGIVPMITLQHFSLPLWLAHDGGWAAPIAPEKFRLFTQKIYAALGSKVHYWVTINEPMVALVVGYLAGLAPPGGGGLGKMIDAMDGMIRGHSLAYYEMKKIAQEKKWASPQIGIAHHLRVFAPKRKWNPFDWFTAHGLSRAFNWSFFDAIETGTLLFKVPRQVTIKRELALAKGTQDFIGINYYSRDQVEFGFKHQFWFNISFRQDRPLTDVGWEIYPKGIYKVCTQASKRAPGKYIIITENGIADAKDDRREDFIKEHLFWIARAIKSKVPIIGYLHWTIFDNFEWSEGYAPRFGLYSVDYLTQARTPRQSVQAYRSIILNNGFIRIAKKLTHLFPVKLPSLK